MTKTQQHEAHFMHKILGQIPPTVTVVSRGRWHDNHSMCHPNDCFHPLLKPDRNQELQSHGVQGVS